MENKNPIISIIVPVYKAEQYVGACIESIQAQTCIDWELILVDDGSPDNSGLICDNYAAKDSRIIVLHKSNGGVSAARNEALKIAKGKYLSFVDSDDYILPFYLSDMLEHEADIVVTGYINQYEPSGRQERRPIAGDRFYSTKEGNLANGFVDIELDTRWLGPAAKLYLRTIVSEHKIFFDDSLDYGEDHLFNMECGKFIKSIAFLNRHNYVYMHRETPSLTNRQVSSGIMFGYITKLYIMRKEYMNTVCIGSVQYEKFAYSELALYYWQTLFTLLNERQKTNKIISKIIHSILKVLPKDILYDKHYPLPNTYWFIRCIYKTFSIHTATIISRLFLAHK